LGKNTSEDRGRPLLIRDGPAFVQERLVQPRSDKPLGPFAFFGAQIHGLLWNLTDEGFISVGLG